MNLILLSAALALAPCPSLAQAASTLPPADAGAAARAAAPAGLRQEIDELKSAFETLSGGVSFSAFFDVQAESLGNASDVVSTGDLEIDLAKEIGKYVQVGAAIVLNKEEATLAVGVIDIHFFGGLIAPTGRLPVEKGFHIQLGRQDVPFGSDWQHFAARDRTELSAPLTTEAILDGGYSGTGLRVLGNTGSFNYSAFAFRVDGPGNLYGGRLGFTPFNNPYRFRPKTGAFEAGASVLHVVDLNGATQETAFALDSEIRVGPCGVQAEYIRKDARSVEGRDERLVQQGWYVMTTFDAGELAGVPTTLYARYDTVTGDRGVGAESLPGGSGPAADPDGGRTKRLTAGVNATLFELVTLKLEFQRFLAASVGVRTRDGFEADALFAQVVFVF